MDKTFADGLRKALQKACPWATGQLHNSIQEAKPYGIDGWIITIGNGTQQTRKIPSNRYAATTNNSRQLKVFARGKRTDPKVPNFTYINNPNYHWATDTVKAYVEANKNQLVVSVVGDEDDEQI